MEKNEELCWQSFQNALTEVEVAGLACIRATGPFVPETKANTDAMRARLLRALWGAIVAIRFGVFPPDTYPVSEGELKMVAEELLATIKR